MTIESRNVASSFGRLIRELRLQKEFSQEDLAALCEFDRTYPSLLERGLRSPTLTVVIRLAVALGVSPASLVTKVYEEVRRS